MRNEDRQKFVEGAMTLFWQRGAEVATYNEIVRSTGASRKALYGPWPEKRDLVAEALLFYRRNILGGLLTLLDRGGRDGLIAFWAALRDAARNSDWPGCFLMRTAGGPMRDEQFVQDIYADYIAELLKRIAAAIEAGQRSGTISDSIDAEVAALQSVGLITLMSTFGALGGRESRIEQVGDVASTACGLKAEETQPR